MSKEMINHPEHYNTGKYEVIDIIEGNNWGEGFNRGNAVKYILRAGIKNPDKEIEDLEKARWYIDREIQRLRAIKNDNDGWPTGETIDQLMKGTCIQNRGIH